MKCTIYNKNGEHMAETGKHIVSSIAPSDIAEAGQAVTGAKTVSQIAEESGISRYVLYKRINALGLEECGKVGRAKVYDRNVEKIITSVSLDEENNKSSQTGLSVRNIPAVEGGLSDTDCGKQDVTASVPYGASGTEKNTDSFVVGYGDGVVSESSETKHNVAQCSDDGSKKNEKQRNIPVLTVILGVLGILLLFAIAVGVCRLSEGLSDIHDELHTIAEVYEDSTKSGWVDLAEQTGDMEHGWLGVTVVDGTATDGADELRGVIVVDVIKGSPAEKAGIEKGDMIYQVDGTVTLDTTGFSTTLQGYEAGDEVELHIITKDDGLMDEVKVTLASYEDIGADE